MTAKKWIVLAVFVLFIGATIIGWFAFRQQFYIFLMYHGYGNSASTRLANLPDVNLPLLEKHLESDRWFVRCSVIRTLRKMDDKASVVPIFDRQLPREKDSHCLLELAVGLIKFKEFDKAKQILQGLAEDSEVGQQARELLKHFSRSAGE